MFYIFQWPGIYIQSLTTTATHTPADFGDYTNDLRAVLRQASLTANLDKCADVETPECTELSEQVTEKPINICHYIQRELLYR